MKRIRQIKWLCILGLIALWASGCRVGVKRGDDGAFRITTSVTEEKLQAGLAAAIADPATQNLTIDLRDGDALITGQRKRDLSDQFDTLSFRLVLSVQDGHLQADISDVRINGKSVYGDAIDAWGKKIADWIDQLGQKRANSTLESVKIAEDKIMMAWRIQNKSN